MLGNIGTQTKVADKKTEAGSSSAEGAWCSADSVTVELQTSSITNISTQTVHRELCVMRFHGWAAAVVTQVIPSFYVILI